MILCPDCKRERDEARERARRIALEERRAALASAAKEPVPHVEGRFRRPSCSMPRPRG